MCFIKSAQEKGVLQPNCRLCEEAILRAFSIWDLLTLCPVSLLGEAVGSPAQLCALCQKSSAVWNYVIFVPG